MSQLRCPNCGNVYSPGQVRCQHCQIKFVDVNAADSQPVNNSNDSESTHNSSSEGPLSGLEDIIPIEPIVSQITKPKPYSIKVQVTPDQQANIRLLDELMHRKENDRPARKSRNFSYQWLLRITVGLVLLVAISLQIFFDVPSLPPPAADPRASKFSQYILSLPNNAPVLLAFDYQPGYAGELDTSTMVVLDQLISRDAYLTLVSTSPSGVAQAERTLDLITDRMGRTYESPADYVNLGFIPGGSTGLSSLATELRLTSPRGINGDQVWQFTDLKNVDSISDFKLVIVVTDNANTARLWIEQVRPHLYSTPMLMIVSVQVEPMILPYYDAAPPQIDGLMVGIMSSASYETFSGRMDRVTNLWSAYSMSIMVAAGLIIAGSLISTIIAASEQDMQNPRER